MHLSPCTCTLNPLKYISISVEKCYCLDANQAIIVYKKVATAKPTEDCPEYKLTITKGPGIFMIQPDEWYVAWKY